MRRARKVPQARIDRDAGICKLVSEGVKPRDVAVRFNLTEARIYQIAKAAKSASQDHGSAA